MKIDRVQLRILKCLQLRLLSTFTWYNCPLCILAGLTFSYLLDHFYSLHGGKKLCRGHFLTRSFSSYPWTAIKLLDVSEVMVRSRTLNDKDCGAVFRIFNGLAVEGSDKEVRTDKIFSDKISPDILCQWWHPGTHTLPVLQADSPAWPDYHYHFLPFIGNNTENKRSNTEQNVNFSDFAFGLQQSFSVV